RLRAVVPQNVQGALANCGGTNLRRARFAGELLRQDLTHSQYLRIFHSLILKGGIRKTSAAARNRPIIQRLLDEDGELLQVRHPRSFVAIYFAYVFWCQRITNLPKRLRPWLLKRKWGHLSTAGMQEIPLLHPSLALTSPGSKFRLRRMDVFKPL